MYVSNTTVVFLLTDVPSINQNAQRKMISLSWFHLNWLIDELRQARMFNLLWLKVPVSQKHQKIFEWKMIFKVKFRSNWRNIQKFLVFVLNDEGEKSQLFVVDTAVLLQTMHSQV